MPDNLEANPEFIQARYQAERNQYDLELMAAAPELVEFGAGGTSGGTSGGSIASTIQTTPQGISDAGYGGGGYEGGGGRGEFPGCPALDQYVLALADYQNKAVPKLVGRLKAGDFLYNPLTGHFNMVSRARTRESEPCFRVKTLCGAVSVVSHTHPIIQSLTDAKGTALGDLFEQFLGADRYPPEWKSVVTVDETHKTPGVSEIEWIKAAGLRDVMEITLDAEYIYATTSFLGNRWILGHNRKYDDFNNQNELQ